MSEKKDRERPKQTTWCLEPGGGKVGVKVPNQLREEVEEAVELYNFESKSAAVRHFVAIGLRCVMETDPRNDRSGEGGGEYSPLTIRDVLPNSKEDALSLRDEEVLERLDEVLVEEVANDPKIEQEGWEVWTIE